MQKRLRWHCHDVEVAPEPLAFPGCSVIGAAHLLGETAGVSRFTSESAFAMHVGAVPLPVSSGASQRHRLDCTGKRKLGAAIHMIALTQAPCTRRRSRPWTRSAPRG